MLRGKGGDDGDVLVGGPGPAPGTRDCGVTPTPARQFTSIRYGERLAEIGAVPSIGTVGDSYDNALAETVNGYYKAELIRGPARTGPWKTVDDDELATLGWVRWHNHSRLHGYLADIPPAEFEETLYATKRTDQALVETQ
jgi:putative transposase